MAAGRELPMFLKAQHRGYEGFSEETEGNWNGPFYFIQGADPQLGLMKAWRAGDCDSGGDEWQEEIQLTEQTVQAINKLTVKPRFFVLCGDLVHGMPGTPWHEEQKRDLKEVLKCTDAKVPLVFVSGNHDIGNTPTADTILKYCQSWGDDYFSFWVGGVLFLVLNSQFFHDATSCPELKQTHDQWLNAQLAAAEYRKSKHVIVFQHIPLFLQDPDEENGYFNLEKSLRRDLLQRFQKAEITKDPTAAKRLKNLWKGRGICRSGCDHSQPPLSLRAAHAHTATARSELQTKLAASRAVRKSFKKILRAGVNAVFSGHYHQNAGGRFNGLDMVVTSAIGCQLGQDKHGVRVVAVTEENIHHKYISLDELNDVTVDEVLSFPTEVNDPTPHLQ